MSEEFQQRQLVESPCVRNCCLDTNDICLGCFRSLEEIIAWSGADTATRLKYLQNANDRRIAYNLD